MMSLAERLALIDQLVSERGLHPPGEIRWHIAAIAEDVESYSKEVETLADLKRQNQQLVAENQKLIAAVAELQGKPQRLVPEGGFGSQPNTFGPRLGFTLARESHS